MKILVVAATEMEILPFLNDITDIDTLIAGVGVPETMYHLSKSLHQFDYDVVIQAGISGSFTDKFQLEECVLVKQDAFADIGIYEKGKFFSVFDFGFSLAEQFPYKAGWLVNESKCLENIKLRQVNGITVNAVGENLAQTSLLKNKYNPDVESMEGAALHYVCLQEHVQFLQLRAISNFVGERDKTKWRMKEAINNLNLQLKNIITQINN
jgi:futalosine hydrolase